MASCRQIISEIQRLPSMSALSPERFADEDGLAYSLVASLGKDLQPTQLRKVFHQVKDLKRQVKQGRQFDRSRLAMIMPILAYSVGRGLIPSDFYELMKVCFGSEKCRTVEDFNRAADFLEAIMAYHKYFEFVSKNHR